MPKSQLIELSLPDTDGKQQKYYTYDGYFEDADRRKIVETRSSWQKFRVTGGCLFAFTGYIATRHLNFPAIHIKNYHIRAQGLLTGVVSGLTAALFLTFLSKQSINSTINQVAINSKHLPLWLNQRYAVNNDRAYFELDDLKNNEPTIFHSGLTEETAAKLIPDRIIGEIPHKPHYPHGHGHGHH